MIQRVTGARYRLRRVSGHCVLHAAVLLMIATTLGGCDARSDSSANIGGNTTSTPLVYAMTNTDYETVEVGVVRGGKIVARQSGRFGSFTRPIWTMDGRYVAALDESTGKGQLIVINSQTGALRAIPCSGCSTIAAIGGSQLLAGIDPVSASSNGDKSANVNDDSENMSMLLVDLASREPPIQVTTTLSRQSSGLVQFLAGALNETLISSWPNSDQPQQLALLKSNGTVVSLGSSNSIVPLGPVASASGAINGEIMFALNGGWEQFVPNEGGGRVFLLDSNTGKRTYTDISVFATPDQLPSSDIQINVYDLWWDHGSLYATISLYVGNPHPAGPIVYKVPPRLWRLDNNRWVQVSSDRMLDTRQLDVHTRAVVIPLKDGNLDGSLYLDVDGKRVHLMDHVSYISSPP